MPPLCLRCRGKGLCGKPCPILARMPSPTALPGTAFAGSSPPSVFVGRYGYPKVSLGILSPVSAEEGQRYDDPAHWAGNKFSIEDVVKLRCNMMNSRAAVNVRGSARVIEVSQEVVQSEKPVDVEFSLASRPTFSFRLDTAAPPFGPVAELKSATIAGNVSVPRDIEKAVSDTDLKASGAVARLYESGCGVHRIAGILSCGLLGVRRKLVPTRWSITAVDTMVSDALVERVKHCPQLDELQLFHGEYIGNHYEIMLMPGPYCYDLVEISMPSAWNPDGKAHVSCDYEPHDGRKSYAAETAGAFYATRLGVAEHMDRTGRQASALVLREVRPDYYAPLGVWVVRETVKKAMQQAPERFDSMAVALRRMQSRMRTDVYEAVRCSALMRIRRAQSSIMAFLR